jgi:hypothetical protein
MENRVGLLFGTIEKSSNNVAINGIINSRSRKTMSSSGSSDDETVVNVHAIWEPINQKPSSNHYDDTCLLLPPSTATTPARTTNEANEVVKEEEEVDIQRALRIGRWLGLRPVGWIFSYTNNDRTKEVNSCSTTTATTSSTLPPLRYHYIVTQDEWIICTIHHGMLESNSIQSNNIKASRFGLQHLVLHFSSRHKNYCTLSK